VAVEMIGLFDITDGTFNQPIQNIPNLPSLSSLAEQKHVGCHYHIYSTTPK
jgi:hypothetical protein